MPCRGNMGESKVEVTCLDGPQPTDNQYMPKDLQFGESVYSLSTDKVHK